MIFFCNADICNSDSFTYFQKYKGLSFDIFSTAQLKAPKRQEHISKGLLKGTKRIYKLDAISVLKFQNHLDIFFPTHQLSPI